MAEFVIKIVISADPSFSGQLDRLIAVLEPVDTTKLNAATERAVAETAKANEALVQSGT